MRREILNDVKRVVVKVGSSSLTTDTGMIDIHRLESFVKQVADLHNKGYDIVIVSSGAIAAGMGKLNIRSRPAEIPLLQAAAAVGQVALIHMYQKMFSEYGKVVAQLLLTRDGLEDANRLYHAKNTSKALLERKVIPIVNENDAVAVEEIAFGDNDTLSAMVANIIDADLLIILSDIDGLYDDNPNENKKARLIDEVKIINEAIRKLAGDTHSTFGTGGMVTKLTAAEIATSSGVHMVIANSRTDWILNSIVRGDHVGTLFRKQEV